LLQRCSRPLCSSQGTGGIHPRSSRTRTSGPFDKGTDPKGDKARERSIPQDPTVCLTLWRVDRHVPLQQQLVVLAPSRRPPGQVIDVPLYEHRRPETFARDTTNGHPVSDRMPSAP
jgi:hypothetical protein